MPKGRIRIRLKAYDHRLVDETCQKIVDTAIKTGATVIGPIPLPTKKEVYVVNKSPFVDKDAREHFGMKIHKRLLDIVNPTNQTTNQSTNQLITPQIDHLGVSLNQNPRM